MLYFWPVFNVYKSSPWFRVIRKALHKGRVTVFTTMFAARVGIDGIICYWQIGFGEDAFYFNIADRWFHRMYAPFDFAHFSWGSFIISFISAKPIL